MGFRFADILAGLLLHIIHSAYSQHILSCNVTALDPCPGNHQICSQELHECICIKGFTLVGAECVVPGPDSSSHSATAAVVTIFTLALLGCGLYLVVRKYNLIEYVRQKINLRRNNDVMYEDVMIGQDDPPLSP